jgi:dTDP-4-dehydrorhamnose 3,5-epimerase
MRMIELSISGVFLITPQKLGDDRGFFAETFRSDLFAQISDTEFVQDNHVRSLSKGVVRGLHFQVPPKAQGKLIRCVRGAILDVAVDIRVGSPTYGKHVVVELSAANFDQLWIPPGFAHGYATLESDCEVIYKVDQFYSAECDHGLAWDDPELAIDWKLTLSEVILSEKDRKLPLLTDLPAHFKFHGQE